MNFQVERLRRLPRRAKETWQGGLVKMPCWVDQEQQKPYRPWSAAWISLETRLVHLTEPVTPQEKSFEMALNALSDFAGNAQLAGYRPGKIQVRDPALAEYLADLLTDADVIVERHNRLFMLDEVLADMAEKLIGRPLLTNALDCKGVTVDLMYAFADAASQFYQTEPWQRLTNEDVVQVESPLVDASLRFLSVLGAGSAVFGLGFYDSLDQFQAVLDQEDPRSLPGYSHWSVLFGPITDLPFGDADLWEEHKLPVADDNAYPLAICWLPKQKHRRPGPHVLAFLEGLMRALVQTSEDELDSGRWQKRTTTASGEMEFTLSLPYLLACDDQDPKRAAGLRGRLPDRRSMEREFGRIERLLEGHEFDNVDQMNQFLQDRLADGQIPGPQPTTPLEKAQDLVYQAFESRGRKQLQLVRQALEICPDCADAYVILAERASQPQQARKFYVQGVAAGRRALGEPFFEENAGDFWGMIETRPYMRALFGLAQCLQEIGDSDEALTHYRQLLRLNPNDNQGVRHTLLPLLLELHLDDEAKELLKQYKDDYALAIWTYGRALMTFRQKGDTATSRKHLQKALDVNTYVPDYLLGRKELPPFLPPTYGLGNEEEAVVSAALLVNAWQDSPGAAEWLESQLRT